MMQNTRRQFVLFSFYDRTGIESWLEKQAQNGWLLEKASAFGWKFHRIEPKPLHFCVTYFPNASAFDAKPGEGQLRFREFCEHTGWKLAASGAQMQIFYNEAADPIPIETDAILDVENIHASMKKSYLFSYIINLILAVMQLGLQFNHFRRSPIENLASTPFLLTALCWVIVLLLLIVEIAGYYHWYRRAKKAAALDGSFIATRGHSGMQFVALFILFAAPVFLLLSYGDGSTFAAIITALFLILTVTAAVIGLSGLLKRLEVSARVNRTLTLLATLVLGFGVAGIACVLLIGSIHTRAEEKPSAGVYYYNGRSYPVYDDALPLYISDLHPTDYEGYSTTLEESRSPLIRHTVARQRTRWDALEQPELEYRITIIRWSPLYGFCRKVLLENLAHNYGRPIPDDPKWESYVTADAAPWSAKEAYRLTIGGEAQQRWLLCYDDRIVELDLDHDWQLTPEQMAVVGSVLGKPSR